MTALIHMSISGTLMILVILLLRQLLQNRVHRSVFLGLWSLAALRLLVPVFISAPTSIYNLLPVDEAATRIVSEPSVADRTGPVSDITAAASPSLSALQIIGLIWLGGAVLCFLWFIVAHIRSTRQYRFALPEEDPPAALLGRVRLRRLDTIDTPMVYGLLRPTILLPNDFPAKDSPEYVHVLLHELCHIRNGDLWLKQFLFLAACVHWFNPLAWLMLYLAAQDMEMRCDAQTISLLGCKRAYAQTLIQAKTRHLANPIRMQFSLSATGSRLRAIAKAKVHPVRSILTAALAVVLLACCFGTMGVPAAKAADGAASDSLNLRTPYLGEIKLTVGEEKRITATMSEYTNVVGEDIAKLQIRHYHGAPTETFYAEHTITFSAYSSGTFYIYASDDLFDVTWHLATVVVAPDGDTGGVSNG